MRTRGPALLAAVSFSVALVADVTTAPGPASALETDLPHHPCMDAQDWSEPACQELWVPGDPGYGAIDEVRVVTPPRGDLATLTMPGPPSGSVDHISWYHQYYDQFVGFHDGTFGGSGCATDDQSCTVGWLNAGVGDAAEKYNVVRGERRMGTTSHSILWFIWSAPRLYPVRLFTKSPDGDEAVLGGGDVAYAVAPGRNPLAGDCVPYDWWESARTQVRVPTPDCITFRVVHNDLKGSFFDAVLPVDSGAWTVVGSPAGDASTPLRQRSAVFDRTTVEPTGDDLEGTLVSLTRPELSMTVEPDSDAMPLGGTQDVAVTVTALRGEAGGLTDLHFASADVLDIEGAPDETVRVVQPVEGVPAGGFGLAPGESRTFHVTIKGVALGVSRVGATLLGSDDLGHPVRGGATGPVQVAWAPPPPGGGGPGDQAPEPPVVVRAYDRQNPSLPDKDFVQGYVKGHPGDRLTVSLAATGTDPCARRMTGDSVRLLGSVTTTVADDGIGSFLLERDVRAGEFVYGVTIAGTRWSSPGACTRVTTVPGPSRPDAWVRARDHTDFAGDGLYNTDAAGQVASVKAKKGATLIFDVLLQNDGTAADRLAVAGRAGGKGWKVRYRSGTTYVTRSVVAGTWRTEELQPGGATALFVEVTVPRKAKVKKALVRLLTVTSATDARQQDAVLLKARRS